jgi:hypothetical protein
VIILSFLPIISIARPGVYESGDFIIHVQRSMSFYASLSEGNIFPSWAGDVNATYGLPLFVFNYTLPYYFISFFHYLGLNFVNSVKIFLALSYVLSGILMYKFSAKLLKNDLAAFASSIFYLFVPYHLIDMHFKTVVGEHLAFTILPLLFLFILKINEDKNKITWTILSGFSFACLINTHVFIALMAAIIIYAYSIFIIRRLKILLMIAAALFTGSVISAYIWLIPFFMSQYTIIQKVKLNFIPLENIHTLFYAPWRFGFLFQGPKGEIAYLIGYTQFFVVGVLAYKLYTNKINPKIKKHVIFWLLIFLFSFIYIFPFSKPFWEVIPFIKSVGQQRLLLLLAFITSVIAGYFALSAKNKKIIYVIILITVSYTILNWGNRRTIPQVTDQIILNNLPVNKDTHFYATPVWVDPHDQWFTKVPSDRIEVTKGTAKVKNIKRTSTNHTYLITAESPIIIQENTSYFPGWAAYVNGESVPIYPSDKGIIKASLPEGKYTFELRYKDYLPLAVLKIISLITIVILLCVLTLAYFKPHKRS